MKDIIIDVRSGDSLQVEVSEEELTRRETERLAIEEELKKPQPPSAEEQFNQLKSTQADILIAMVMNDLM